MFHPVDHPMRRGWVGRIEDDHVVQLAAQTLQSFFTGGGSAREHAVYPLGAVRLLAPVLHPPSVRIFTDDQRFEFGNPAAVLGPEGVVAHPRVAGGAPLDLRLRLAAVVGLEGAIAGYTAFADWRAPELSPPKDRDFAFGLGPAVVTADQVSKAPEATVRVDDGEVLHRRFGNFDWAAARDLAAQGTTLCPGDLVAGPALDAVEQIEPGSVVQIAVEGIGTLPHTVRAEN